MSETLEIDSEPDPAQRETQVCTSCGEEILAVAKKCRFCGLFLDRQLELERRRRAVREGWDLALSVPISLAVQVLAGLACSVWVAFDDADGPVVTLGCFLLFFAAVFVVTSLTPYSEGRRLRTVGLAAGNGLAMLACFVLIQTFSIPPWKPSLILSVLGLVITGASVFAFLLVLNANGARERAS